MTIQALKKKKQELLASQISNLVSDTNENLLRVNLSKFFTDLEQEVQSALMEYWSDTMLLQGQVNLILASIHEKHQEYYELIMKHKLQEFHRAEQQGKRLVKRQEQSAMKASKPVKMTATRNNLFGTLKYSEDKLANDTFKASQNTLNRVDSNINEILTDGYKSGVGINEVSRQITERFDQLRTWEATRIARTEIHTAQNMGIMNSYESLGVEYTQWIAADDDRTRESHLEVDREIIPIGETYSNGLAYPGDTSGPIEEWINCRCSNAPFVMPAGMMAPSFSPFKESDLIPVTSEAQITPSIESTIESTNPLPLEIKPKLDQFGKQYEYSQKEHLQYFTKTESSEISHGLEGEVRKTGAQRRWLNEKGETKEQIHSIHNHPTSEKRLEGYTMLSHEDFQTFVKENIVGTERGIPLNMKTSSAENQYNRITVERLDNFHEVYQKGIKPEETLGRGTSYAISRAVKIQEEFYDKYNPTVTPGMEYLRKSRRELKEQKVPFSEFDARMKPHEAKAEELDKKLFEERQKEFPKLIEAMNKELNPYGLNIYSEYKIGVHAKPVTPKANSKINSPPKKETSKISKEEVEQLEFLKEQLDMAKQDLKRLSKDNPQYVAIQKMAINTRKKIKELEKKMK